MSRIRKDQATGLGVGAKSFACLAAVCALGFPGIEGPTLSAGEPAGKVTVTLSGGARIDAELLRQMDDRVILDLGYDVISIPSSRVLDIRDHAMEESLAQAETDGIFSVGRLESAPVSELVERHGDSVFMVRTPAGLGSGFFISDEGHLVTNYHVIEGQTDITVTLFIPTGRGYERREMKRVRILAMHPLRDLALLQIDREELGDHEIAPLLISSDGDVRVGEAVFAIGNPLGLERSVTQGIVSSTTRTIGHLRFLQTDASINPGNSGGPIFNLRGEVVGVVCAGATFFQGLAFGIPAADLVDFLENWNAYLYDPSQPQNSITYLPPPFRQEH